MVWIVIIIWEEYLSFRRKENGQARVPESRGNHHEKGAERNAQPRPLASKPQNLSLAANWIRRGLFTVLVIAPKPFAELLTAPVTGSVVGLNPVPGTLNCG